MEVQINYLLNLLLCGLAALDGLFEKVLVEEIDGVLGTEFRDDEWGARESGQGWRDG